MPPFRTVVSHSRPILETLLAVPWLCTQRTRGSAGRVRPERHDPELDSTLPKDQNLFGREMERLLHRPANRPWGVNMASLVDSVTTFLENLGCAVTTRSNQVVGERDIVGGRVTFAVRVEDRKSFSQLPAESVYVKRFTDGFPSLPDDVVKWVVLARDAMEASGRYNDFRRAMAAVRVSVGSLDDFLGTFVPRAQVAKYLTQRMETLLHNVGYVPQHLAADGSRKALALETVLEWMSSASPSRLAVIHAPAAHGKTIFVERVVRELLKPLRPEGSERPRPIPFLVKFAEHRGVESVDDLLLHVLEDIGRGDIPVEALKELIRRGQILLLFDGLDELSEEVGDKLDLENVKLLADLIRKDSDGRVLVTCRSTFLETRRAMLLDLLSSGHEVWELLPFDEEDQLRFLEQNPPEGFTGDGISRHRDRVVSFLKQNPVVSDFATSPFLLKQISVAVAENQTALPRNMGDVYSRFLTSLCEREIKRQQHDIAAAKQLAFLRRLAHEMVFEQAYAYPVDLFAMVISEELETDISRAHDPKAREREVVAKLTGHAAFAPTGKDRGPRGREVQFLHESMRDYCAASHLIGLLGAADPHSSVSRSAFNRRRLPEGVIAFMRDGLDARGLSALGQIAYLSSSLVDNENLFRIAAGSDVSDGPSIAFALRRCANLNLRGLVIEDAALKKFTFDGSDLGGTRFSSCDLRDADFRLTNLEGATFDDCDLAGAQFNELKGLLRVDDLTMAGGDDLAKALLDRDAVVGGRRQRTSRDVALRAHGGRALVEHAVRKFYVGTSPVNARKRVRYEDVLERGRAGDERVLIRSVVVPALESAGLLERYQRGIWISLGVKKDANPELINFLFRGTVSDRLGTVIREVDKKCQESAHTGDKQQST